ncbi:hypothetical protein [Vibrio jasicida]|uniref:hypothetical protein n=1 Tax=Vibrio jasicida TaxID=766224 RepID=UPI0003A2B698|nr:hypothetical protein [Vibrio jasicida]
MSQRSFKARKKRERKRQHASKQVRRERSKKAQASTRSKASTAARERITVCVKAPRPESEEASMNTAQKYQQTLRKLGAQMKQLVEEDEDFFVPGFTPSRVTVDKYGQVKHRLVKMSAYFQQVLTMCENVVHNPAVLPRLAAYCPGMKRKDVRTYTAQVLAVLLCSSEFEGGRIGYLQVGAEMNPKSHRELMKEYLLRFGQEINEKTWYAAYDRLKKAGYIQDMKVTLPIDLPREGQEQLTLIRSAAAYKQFTPRFFEHFKVTRFENVKALIQAGIAKQKAQGYGFKWVSYSILAKGIRDRIQAQFLNELINDTSPVVGTHTSPDIPIPY